MSHDQLYAPGITFYTQVRIFKGYIQIYTKDTAVQWADYVSLQILYFLLLTYKRLNEWFWASVCS